MKTLLLNKMYNNNFLKNFEFFNKLPSFKCLETKTRYSVEILTNKFR